MMKWMLAAGAAALAIAAPIAAERGGKGQGQSQAQKGERGGGKVRAQGGGGDRQTRAQRGGGDSMRGNQRRQSFATVQGNRDDRGGRGNAERQRGKGNDNVRVEARGRDRDNTRVVRVDDNRGRARGSDDLRTVRADGGKGRGNLRFIDNDENRIFRVRDNDRGVVRFRDVNRDDLFFSRLGYGVGGCPPGLAKKGNGCLPPGQAAKFIGQPLLAASRLGALGAVPLSLRNLYWDDDDYYYRYGGGYMYRVDRDNDLIDGLLPLFGAALIGQQLQPNYYQNSFIPPYYNSFYPNSSYDCHRYGYGYVYETDCMTGMVENVIPTYDYGYGVGQMLPASYGYYNVPYPYRSHFADADDYYYRYAPGAIYRVDRDTSLITSVAALLGGGLSVGQPLPLGYGAYNVPLGYRDSYYDTPNDWYRYSDGYIYRVDPTTQLVTALIRAIA